MDLLDFARGPALQVALAVFVLGTLWRLAGVLLLPRVGDRSALGSIARRMWPRRELAGPTLFVTVNSYVFHVGLAVVVFGFGPHVLFIRDLLGLSWPTLPSNLVFGVGVVTLVSLLAVLGRRLTHPVTRLLSRASDYIGWALTALPVATGLMAAAHVGIRYETLLALHLLSIAAFLLWFPFGTLMHAVLVFFSRAATGMRFGHRGVDA